MARNVPALLLFFVLVRSSPPGAAVYLDGASTSQVTPAELPVETAGRHAVEVRMAGYRPQSFEAALNESAPRAAFFAILEGNVPGRLEGLRPGLPATASADLQSSYRARITRSDAYASALFAVTGAVWAAAFGEAYLRAPRY